MQHSTKRRPSALSDGANAAASTVAKTQTLQRSANAAQRRNALTVAYAAQSQLSSMQLRAAQRWVQSKLLLQSCCPPSNQSQSRLQIYRVANLMNQQNRHRHRQTAIVTIMTMTMTMTSRMMTNVNSVCVFVCSRRLSKAT